MSTIDGSVLFSGDVTVAGTLTQLKAMPDDTIARSKLIEDALAEYVQKLQDMRVTGTGALLGTSAGTPSGAFGLTVGTHGSATPVIVGETASNNSKTNKLRFTYELRPEYVAAGTVHVRVRAKVDGTLATAQTLDLTCFKADEDGGLGSDLCTTTIKTLTTSYVDYAFIINPAGLAVGDVLDIEITGVADDTGGAANKAIYISKVSVLADIKG